jgi:hypothetical protein
MMTRKACNHRSLLSGWRCSLMGGWRQSYMWSAEHSPTGRSETLRGPFARLGVPSTTAYLGGRGGRHCRQGSTLGGT